MIDTEKKIILVNGVGTAAEWYNYMIAFTLPLDVISSLLPSHGKDAALTFASWTMMAVYLLRPLFAIGFGYIGDKFSRDLVVRISKIMMLSSALMMFIVPGYDTVGIISTAVLIVSRVLQVGAVSGDLLATMVIAGESSPASTRAGSSSIVCVTMIAGSLLSLIVKYICSWRISFVIGILLLILSELIKSTIKKDFAERKSAMGQRNISIRSLVTKYRLQLLSVFLSVSVVALIFYITLSAVPNVLNRSNTDFKLMYIAANLLSMAAIYTYGRVLNVIGWGFGHLISSALVLITIVPASGFILSVANCVALHKVGIWIAYCWISIINGMLLSSLPSILFNSFPKEIRLTGAGLAYNLSVATFGGSAQILFSKSVLIGVPQLITVPIVLISITSMITVAYGLKRGIMRLAE